MGDEVPQRKGCAVPERCRPSILSWAIIWGHHHEYRNGSKASVRRPRHLDGQGRLPTLRTRHDYPHHCSSDRGAVGGRNREALSPRATAQPSTCETRLHGGGPSLCFLSSVNRSS